MQDEAVRSRPTSTACLHKAVLGTQWGSEARSLSLLHPKTLDTTWGAGGGPHTKLSSSSGDPSWLTHNPVPALTTQNQHRPHRGGAGPCKAGPGSGTNPEAQAAACTVSSYQSDASSYLARTAQNPLEGSFLTGLAVCFITKA